MREGDRAGDPAWLNAPLPERVAARAIFWVPKDSAQIGRREACAETGPKPAFPACPAGAVKESIERVRRATINSGVAFPMHAVLIHRAPADVKKQGRNPEVPIPGSRCVVAA